MSGLNESGLSLALHYKHNDQFNLSGESIFFIASEILYHAGSIRDALKILKTKNSMSQWGLYLSDRNGEVLALDICGKDIHHEKFQLQDHKYLYFNNRPIVKRSENLQPFGNRSQCIMRAESVKQRMKSTNLKKENLDLMKLSLEILGKENSQITKNTRDWKLSPITPSSLQLYSFHNSRNQAYFVKGNDNKFYTDSYLNIDSLFTSPLQKSKKKNDSSPSIYQTGIAALTKYQMSIDKGDIVGAYHNIQMGIEYLEGFPEKYIAKFFFFTTQYIYENDKRDLAYLYNDFRTLDGLLPEYLEEQRLLFLMRLEKILGHNIKNRSQLFKNESLLKLYKNEVNKNALAIKGLKHLIFPRIDVLDVIYAF